jgi:hypothetical protein
MRTDRPLLIVAALVVIAFVVLAKDMPVDDAYISFRYAANLADGHGLTFNAGERVEGYSNFLWVLVLAGASFVHDDIPAASKALSVVLTILTVAVFLRILAGLSATRGFSWLGMVFLLSSGPFLYWGQNGMETALFTLLVVLGFHLWTRRDDGKLLATVVLMLATLTRPEGVLVYPTLLAVELVRRHRDRERPWNRELVLSTCGFLLLLVGFETWRWLYFGSLLPNTFHAKIASGPTLGPGLLRLKAFALSGGGVVYLVSALFVLARRRLDRTGPLPSLLALVAVFLACLVYSGGDIYYLYRYYLPILPFLTITLTMAAFDLGSGLQSVLSHRAPLLGRSLGALAAVAICGYLASPYFIGPDHAGRTLSQASDRRRLIIGEWMRNNLPEDSSVALNAIGIIPHVTGFRAYDMVGLTDRHIARLEMTGKRLGAPGHRKYDGAYILARKPDYILLSNAVLLTLSDQDGRPIRETTRFPPETFLPLFQRDFAFLPGDAEIFGSEAFAADYECWVIPIGKEHLILFKRADTRDFLSQG